MMYSVLIIGDCMYDKFYDKYNKMKISLGGAGNVHHLLQSYRKFNIHTLLTQTKDRCTKIYRPIRNKSGQFKMESKDIYTNYTFKNALQNKYNYNTEEMINDINSYDFIIFADHEKGFITPESLNWFYRIIKKNKSYIIVDSKDKNNEYYKFGTILKHNENEAYNHNSNFKYKIRTLGKQGGYVYNLSYRFSTEPIKNFVNAIGAGDGFVCGLINYIADKLYMANTINTANTSFLQISELVESGNLAASKVCKSLYPYADLFNCPIVKYPYPQKLITKKELVK